MGRDEKSIDYYLHTSTYRIYTHTYITVHFLVVTRINRSADIKLPDM